MNESFIMTESPEAGFEIALSRISQCNDSCDQLMLHQLGLTELPLELFKLKNLRTLNLLGNRLTHLPPEFSAFNRLQELWLYENDFSEFPRVLTTLSRLEHIKFGNNRLSFLPAAIGKMASLRVLLLDGNDIRSFPIQMKNLVQLEALGLDGNSIANIEIRLNEEITVPFGHFMKNVHAQQALEMYFAQYGIPTVFLSYARSDMGAVENIRKMLMSSGSQIWMDIHDMVGGEDWERAIERAINDCEVFIAVLSENSVGRRGMVQKELGNALRKLDEMLPQDIYIVPVRLDQCPIPERLSHLHLIEWNGGKNSHLLVQSVTAALDRRMNEN